MSEYKLYSVYDGENNSLMADEHILEAKNSRDAVRMLLLCTNRRDYKIKRGGKNPSFKTTQFYEKDGQKYKKGKCVWYEKL